MLPVFVQITGSGSNYNTSTVITYDTISIIQMPFIVLSPNNICQLVWTLPSWLTGVWDNSETVKVTVDELSTHIFVVLLPGILD